MESRDVLKIHGALRRYCTSRVSLRSTLEVQYLLNLPCIFNTSLDSMLYLLITLHTTCNIVKGIRFGYLTYIFQNLDYCICDIGPVILIQIQVSYICLNNKYIRIYTY